MATDFPKQVRIENTNLCNASCIMCPREQLSRAKGTMDLEFFSRILKELAEGGIKTIHLHGYGEPFLDRNIFEKIRLAKRAGIAHTFLITNASLLDDERIKRLLGSGLDAMKISFYGIDKAEYESIHKGLSFDEVKGNIEHLLREKRKSGGKKPLVIVRYEGSLPKFFRFALQWGLKTGIAYARFHNYAYGRAYSRPKIWRKKRTCPIVRRSVMQVLWDGAVVPCCYDFDGRVILGDLKRQTVREVWNSEEYERFREIHSKREYERIPICYNCDKLR